MTIKNHIVNALSISLLLKAGVIGTGFMIVGSLIPDLIDSKVSSAISYKDPKYYFNKIHRRLSHYWLLYFIVLIISYNVIIVIPFVNMFLFFASIGALSHIFFDAFTPTGVPILNPFRPIKTFVLYTYNSKAEWIFTYSFLFISFIIFLIR